MAAFNGVHTISSPSTHWISGCFSAASRQHCRKRPSDMRMMLALCTAVTLDLQEIADAIIDIALNVCSLNWTCSLLNIKEW